MRNGNNKSSNFTKQAVLKMKSKQWLFVQSATHSPPSCLFTAVYLGEAEHCNISLSTDALLSYEHLKTWLHSAPALQSCSSWTAEEGAPPVTGDIPDVARTPHVKWPECSRHVKYVSGLSKQCIQFSEGWKLCTMPVLLGWAVRWTTNLLWLSSSHWI